MPVVAFGIVMAPASFDAMFGIPWDDLWHRYHPLVYTAKTLAAASLLWVFRRAYMPIRVAHTWLAILTGLIGIVEWIGVDKAVETLGPTLTPPPTSYDPLAHLGDVRARAAFYTIRIVGATLVVPIMEELFWRDFLMRLFIRPDQFQAVPIGTFSWISLIGTSVLFAAAHAQWPSALLYGLMMGALVAYTRSLGACIIAHSVTNLTLAGYVLTTGAWRFW